MKTSPAEATLVLQDGDVNIGVFQICEHFLKVMGSYLSQPDTIPSQPEDRKRKIEEVEDEPQIQEDDILHTPKRWAKGFFFLSNFGHSLLIKLKFGLWLQQCKTTTLCLEFDHKSKYLWRARHIMYL